MDKSLIDRNIDIGIITIVPTEIDALFESLDIDPNEYEDINSPLNYWRANFFSSQCNRNVSIVVSILSGEAGNIESAITTANFLRDWNPRLMCIVGIAAGIFGKVKIGDVVIPNKIHDRTVKVFIKGEYKARSFTHIRLDTTNRLFKVFPIQQNDFQTKVMQSSSAEITNAKKMAKKKGLTEAEFSTLQEIHDGSLISDNILIRDNSYFGSILDVVDEKCRGGEMEAAGFVRACNAERDDFPWLVIRGISDFGDHRKDDAFQLLAAKNACTALKMFIEQTLNVDLLPENPRSKIGINTLEFNLMHQLRKAYDSERWQEVCRIGSVLGRPLWLAGHYNLRMEVGKMVEAAADYSGNSQLRARTLIDDLGWNSFKIGNKMEGKKYINDGIRLAKESNDFYALAKGFRHLASISRQADDITTVEKYLTQANKAVKKIGDPILRQEMEISLISSEGKLYFKMKDYEKALARLLVAMKQFEDVKDFERSVKLYSLLGQIQIALGDMVAAKQYFTEGRLKAREMGRFDEFSENTRQLIKMLSEDQGELINELVQEVIQFAASNGLWNEVKNWKQAYEPKQLKETTDASK